MNQFVTVFAQMFGSRPRSAAAVLVTMFASLFACPLRADILNAYCQFQVNDVYGQPASGVPATLTLQSTSTQETSASPDVSATGYSDANGYAYVSINAQGGTYGKAICSTYAAAGGYTAYNGDQSLLSFTDGDTLSGSLIVIPKPKITIPFSGGGDAALYQSGGYDKPVVIAQPFDTDEPKRGQRKPPSQVWSEYNGNPALLSQRLLELLYSKGYDVWLVRPSSTGADLHLQAMDFAQAVQNASQWESYNNKVAVAGYSLGGLVVRTAMSRWDWDTGWRNSLGLVSQTPPVNLIITLDSPLRGALVSNDLQHAMWNASFNDGKAASEHNMDSCAAQQMLENGCHKPVGAPDDLECNDRGWYETFYGGNNFAYCSPAGSGQCGSAQTKSCSNPGVGILTQPNGGWPAGIRKIGASMGKISERTGVCYGDNDTLLRDKRGNLSDGCPGVDAQTFDLGTEWGYLDITFSTDRHFYYESLDSSADSWRQHSIDELTPGSRQMADIQDITMSFVNPHQFRHAGTFIPLYSALDQDPSTGAIPFDEYWTNSYSAFHDAVSDKATGTWVNQRTSQSGSASMPQWLVKNLDDAFSTSTSSSPCGEATCVPAQGAYISHFTSADCTGTESYYLPYDGYAYSCRTWDGNGQCGTIHRTVTNVSYKYNGSCYNAWPSGNTLSDFVTVYRGGGTSSGCGEASCLPAQAAYISHFTGAGCTGTESYYLPYDGYAYSCRTWDGNGQCGTIHRTVTNVSYKYNGACYDAWPGGNTLSDFVTVYR